MYIHHCYICVTKIHAKARWLPAINVYVELFKTFHKTEYRIHSNRGSYPNRRSPPFTIKLLAHKIGEVDDFVLKMHGFEVKFKAHHYAPVSWLAHAQCATIRMNRVLTSTNMEISAAHTTTFPRRIYEVLITSTPFYFCSEQEIISSYSHRTLTHTQAEGMSF